MRMTIGEKLETLRQRAGLSVAKLAGQAEVSEPQLRRFLRDEATPALPTLLRLAATLGVALGEFEDARIVHDRRFTKAAAS